jgi:hypothetical protein
MYTYLFMALLGEKQSCDFFFFCEGPRSWCYGRTAALRLFVQPYDEDEQFFTKFYK